MDDGDLGGAGGVEFWRAEAARCATVTAPDYMEQVRHIATVIPPTNLPDQSSTSSPLIARTKSHIVSYIAVLIVILIVVLTGGRHHTADRG